MTPPDTLVALGSVLRLDPERSLGRYHLWRGELMPGVSLELYNDTESPRLAWTAATTLSYCRPIGIGVTPDEAIADLCAAVQTALREAHLLGQLVHLLTPARRVA
jgi:hypothetical protein